MGRTFVVPEKLMPLVKDVRRTLVEDCEKDIRIELASNGGSGTAWLKVSGTKHEKKDGIIRANGAIGPNRYKFFAHLDGASFESDCNHLEMAEQVFYLFIGVIAVYRNIRGLSPLDTRMVDALAVEDSPPVNAENYAVMPPDNRINKLASLINKKFWGTSSFERSGRFFFYICSTVGRMRLPLKYVPIYTDLINSFESAFSVGQARLFAVRCRAEQRLYFVTEDDRVYYCKADDSMEFLEKHSRLMFDSILESSPNYGRVPVPLSASLELKK
ncbi:MAG: hypothetical protein LBD86_06640 [Spirochaetaceae bacterium]|jgi:hypothetical protein|nr:hypothetical protein [Spirochaetaceae bacterium]